MRKACEAHATQEWPKEAVGAVLRRPDGSLTYSPLPNTDPTPDEAFRVPEDAMLGAMEQGELVGIHHSHPRGNLSTGEGFCPSGADMEAQLAWRVPFYITVMHHRAGTPADFFGWGDELPPLPLLEREFRPGVTDCYALVRHAHFARTGEVLPDGPREPYWWDDPASTNPIMDNLTRKGFKEVPRNEVQPGDFLLFALRRGLVSHCGVFADSDLFLHHLYGRLSRVDLLPQWSRYLALVVRFSAPGAEQEERHDGSNVEDGSSLRAPS